MTKGFIVLYEENVRRGISLLDENVTDWRDRIDWETLDIWSLDDCVLGQLFDTYSLGWEEIVSKTDHRYGWYWGFDMEPGNSKENYRLLTETWKALAIQ